MTSRRLVALLVLGWVSCPAPLWAQLPPPGSVDDVRRDARIHFGSVYVTPMFQVSEFGWDTNVFNENGEPRSDFMFTLTPKAYVWMPLQRRALLTAAVGTDLVWYSRFDTERSVNPQLGGRAEVFLRRLTLFAESTYTNTRARPNFEIDQRSRRSEETVSGGAEVKLTPKFALNVAAGRSSSTYDANAFVLGTNLKLQETLNRTERRYTIRARHTFTPLTSAEVRADFSRDEFPFSPNRNSDSVRVGGAVHFKPRALIAGDAFVGIRQFTPVHPQGGLPEFRGIVADVALSYELLGATVFGASISRDLRYSIDPLRPYYVDLSAGGSIRRALGPRFDLLASLDRHNYDYRDSFGEAVLPSVERRDTTWSYAASVGYRPRRDVRVGLGATYWRRESSVGDSRQYDRIRIGTTITYGMEQ